MFGAGLAGAKAKARPNWASWGWPGLLGASAKGRAEAYAGAEGEGPCRPVPGWG